MNRLVSDPTTAMASSIPPIISGSPFQRAKRNDPTLVPSTMAAKVESSSSPLARVNCASLSISGRMPYFAGLKKLACIASRNRTTSSISMLRMVKSDHADAHDHDFESLGDLENARFAEAIGELAGVTGEQQEWQNEDGARNRQVARAEQLIRGQLHRAHRHDHLINVVVERGQELRPEEGLKAAVAARARHIRWTRVESHSLLPCSIFGTCRRLTRRPLCFNSLCKGVKLYTRTCYVHSYTLNVWLSFRGRSMHFLSSVAKLGYGNPFLPERIAYEKAALGREFVAGGEVWSASVSDPEAEPPNVTAIYKKLVGADGGVARAAGCGC